MQDLPEAWRSYANLQNCLLSRSRLSDFYWGLEAGLDQLLDHGANASPSEDPFLAINRGRTRERHRRILRTRFLNDDEAFDPNQNLEDRETVRLVYRTEDQLDRSILDGMAVGLTSSEVSAILGVKSVTVRQRLSRLRRRIAA